MVQLAYFSDPLSLPSTHCNYRQTSMPISQLSDSPSLNSHSFLQLCIQGWVLVRFPPFTFACQLVLLLCRSFQVTILLRFCEYYLYVIYKRHFLTTDILVFWLLQSLHPPLPWCFLGLSSKFYSRCICWHWVSHSQFSAFSPLGAFVIVSIFWKKKFP